MQVTHVTRMTLVRAICGHCSPIGASPTQRFEEALAAARAEGNLSRTNASARFIAVRRVDSEHAAHSEAPCLTCHDASSRDLEPYEVHSLKDSD